MHKSVRLETPCEFINVQPLNPLISKCQIKVCYVGEQPNRNRSIITKEVARKMANSLPGSPIVGYFNESKGDFEEHNRTASISNGKFEIKDATRPYGFVDLNAKCWFQKYLDDDAVEREYLVTEGYLWTGQYPECQRCVEGEGNNQSMELDKDLIDAHWTKDNKGKPQFFIINEAIVSKLCILGEDCEPCFEGSNITREVQFSLDDNFKEQLFSMMQELKDLLQEKGGAQVFTTYAVEIGDSLWNSLFAHIEAQYPSAEEGHCSMYSIEGVYEESSQKFAILQSREDMKYYRLNFALDEENNFSAEELTEVAEFTPSEEPQFAAEAVSEFEAEYAKKKKEDEEKEEEGKEDKSDDSKPEDKEEEGKEPEDKKEDPEKEDAKEKEEDEDDEKKKKKNKYILEEIPEYVELLEKFSALESELNTLKSEKEALEAQIQPLAQFKKEAEKAQKEEMIKSFYMLSDEDKKDVVDNIDTYSLDEIEAKLSIICVRNKVSFSLEDDKDTQRQDDPTVYNLGGNFTGSESTPAWVKAALDVAKEMK